MSIPFQSRRWRNWRTMDPKSQRKFERWVAKGDMEPSAILGRISDGLDYTLRLRRDDLPPTGEMNESAFISMVLKYADLPPSWAPLGQIIYRAIAYLSSTPFYPQPDSAVPSSLSVDEIQRGLLWILPKLRANVFSTLYPTRAETRANHSRMLFQSLASTKQNVTCNAEKARRRVARNAAILADKDARIDPEELMPNYDDHGDEIFHDVFLILPATQPGINSPPISPVPQDGFLQLSKDVAKSLPELCTLAIPSKELTTVIQYLLVLQFDYQRETLEELDLSSYEEAAKSIVAMFTGGTENGLINWPSFDDAIVQVPFLFDPLFRILRWTFLARDPDDVSSIQEGPKPLPENTLLTAPRMSQLGATLYDLDFSHFKRAHLWHKGIRPSGRVLLHAMESMPRLSLLVISGVVPSMDKEYIVGIFRPVTTKWEKRIQEEEHLWSGDQPEKEPPVTRWRDVVHDYIKYSISYRPDEYDVYDECVARPLMIILSPRHRVVRLEEKLSINGDGALSTGDQFQILDDGSTLFQDVDGLITIRVNAIEIWGEITDSE